MTLPGNEDPQKIAYRQRICKHEYERWTVHHWDPHNKYRMCVKCEKTERKARS